MSNRCQLKPFKLLTVQDVKVLPDPEWLIDDILPKGGIAVLYGQSGTGKSFLALDWAAHICAGLPWLGRSVEGNRCAVYVYAEGRTGLKRRVEAWEAEHAKELVGSPGLEGLRFLPQAVNIPEPNGDASALIQSIQKIGLSPGLIIIDTLARNFGGGDENAAVDMNAFIAGLDKLKDAFPGASVLVIHHAGKDSRKGLRGNTALLGAVDAAMRLNNQRGLLTLSCEKQKDGEEFKPIALMLKLVLGQRSLVIAEGHFSVGRGGGEPAILRSDETDRKAMEALAALDPASATFAKWYKATGLPKSTFKDARTRLLERGKVIQEGNVYRIAQAGPEAEIRPEQGSPPLAA